MGCATGMVKYLVFLFNLLFFLTGLAFLVVGIIFAMDYGDAVDLPDEGGYFKIAPIGSIIIGAFVLVISFFGCCGAIKESPCMLITYSSILFAILLAQIGIGVFALITVNDEDDLLDIISKQIKKLFDKYPTNNVAKEALDSIQTALECCGKDDPIDWLVNIPSSCCSGDSTCTQISNDKFMEGCNSALFTFLKDSLNMIGIVLLSLGVTEVLAGICAICLSMSVKREKNSNHY